MLNRHRRSPPPSRWCVLWGSTNSRICVRLFYLEQAEQIRVASGAVYAGRVLHPGAGGA
jgi:hypothetical protein